MKQLNKEQILKETVKYYSTNPRGLDNKGNCQYYTDEGNMCAVGRCLTLKARKQLLNEGIGGYSHLYDHYESKVPFLKRYQGHNVSFWQDLQNFHDVDGYWKLNNKGGYDLTTQGHLYYEYILKRIKNNLYES